MNRLVEEKAILCSLLLSLLTKPIRIAITGRTDAAVPVDGTIIGLLVEDGRIRSPRRRAVRLLTRRPCQVGASLG